QTLAAADERPPGEGERTRPHRDIAAVTITCTRRHNARIIGQGDISRRHGHPPRVRETHLIGTDSSLPGEGEHTCPHKDLPRVLPPVAPVATADRDECVLREFYPAQAGSVALRERELRYLVEPQPLRAERDLLWEGHGDQGNPTT